jgi:hypothetical protein
MGGDETNNNETNQAKNKAAALKAEEKVKIKKENKIFPNKSYIPENRMFTVVI